MDLNGTKTVAHRGDITMRQIYVADVGDGLCIAIHTIFGKTIQIDCGSHDGSNVALNGFDRIYRLLFSPDVFCLSHFHADHYNGLLQASTLKDHPRLQIKEVYYPKIPEFSERQEFLEALFAVNLRLFGDETGVMAYDFLRTIEGINGVRFHHRPLSKDDIIDINGSSFRVLWPPEEILGKTLARIRRALKDFRKALEDDQEMRRLYEHVKKEGFFKEYLTEGGRREPKEYELMRREKRRQLPDIVVRANKSLRCAANDLSLALSEDNRLLFLGDVNSHEIRQIIEDLTLKGRKRFYVFITPHHGTHWHSRLRKISCIYSVSSTGKRLISNVNPGYKSISTISLCTHANGDLVIPSFFRGWWGFL